MNSTRFKRQGMRALWKLLNQRESVWNHLYRKIMKIISQAKEKLDDTLQFGSQVYSYALCDENSGCESSSGQGMEEARNDSRPVVGQS